MLTKIDPVLFLDLQAAIPTGFCPDCGSERYGPLGVCLRCERRMP